MKFKDRSLLSCSNESKSSRFMSDWDLPVCHLKITKNFRHCITEKILIVVIKRKNMLHRIFFFLFFSFFLNNYDLCKLCCTMENGLLVLTVYFYFVPSSTLSCFPNCVMVSDSGQGIFFIPSITSSMSTFGWYFLVLTKQN